MALEFDGSSQYVKCSPLSNDSSGTFTIWINITDITQTMDAITAGDEGSLSYFLRFLRIGTDRYPSIIQENNDTVDWVRGNTTLQNSTEYFICTQSTGSKYKIFVNGDQETITVVSGSNTGDWLADTSNIDNFVIAALYRSNINPNFHGKIWDVRYYNRVLSPEEIEIIYYSRGNDSIVDGLVGRWLMNEKPDGSTASGSNSVIDISGNSNHGTPYNSPVYRASPMKLTKPFLNVRKKIFLLQKPAGLLCEGKTNPIDVSDLTPEFSAKFLG